MKTPDTAGWVAESLSHEIPVEQVATTMETEDSEGKLDRLLDKLFPWRSNQVEVEPSPPAELSGDVTDEGAQASAEPEVVVVGTTRRGFAPATVEDDVIATPSPGVGVTDESTARAATSDSDQAPTSRTRSPLQPSVHEVDAVLGANPLVEASDEIVAQATIGRPDSTAGELVEGLST